MTRNLIALPALLIIAALISHQIPNPCQTPLYQNVLLSRDRHQIFDYFEAHGISYEWSPERQQILVPKEQAQGLRRELFDQGLPTGVARCLPVPLATGRKGAEQKAIAQQLLEGELTQLLISLPSIDDAWVRLSVPDHYCFGPPLEPRTYACVYIAYRAPIDPSIWPTCSHYLQMVVPNPAFNGLTVIDSRGDVVYSGEFDPPKELQD